MTDQRTPCKATPAEAIALEGVVSQLPTIASALLDVAYGHVDDTTREKAMRALGRLGVEVPRCSTE